MPNQATNPLPKPMTRRAVPIAFLSILAAAGLLGGAPGGTAPGARPLEDRVTHGYADSDGVRIHCASLGAGPLIVMLHGYPDYWMTWRNQMDALATDHTVVAIDLRGYNRSDAPPGVDNYAMRLLLGDVAAVIRHFGRDRAVIVGHDWGGAIAWNFAMYRPEMTEKLIVCNLPHPRGIVREMSSQRSRQHGNSQYARDLQAEDSHERLTAEGLAGWVKDDVARPKYVEAFRRSDFEAMTNYYRKNFPRRPAPGEQPDAAPSAPPPVIKVKAPVLMIHGLDDPFLLPGALNDTWEWLDNDLTLVTIPGAGHFVQHDAADLVTRTMRSWLDR